MHRHLLTLTLTTFVTWIGQRVTAVALPLVAYWETGDAWTTGLVGGMAGLPLLTVPWWGRPLRGRLTSGRALAGVLAVQVVGLLLVPTAAATGTVSAVVLCASGLVTGVASALTGPAQRALTADLADDAGATRGDPAAGAALGTKALAWQDLAHRSSMIFAPPLAAWLLVAWGAEPLLWGEAGAVALAALVMLSVPAARTVAAPADADTVPAPGGPARTASDDSPALPSEGTDSPSHAPTIRSVLRSDQHLAVGIGLAGIGGVTWFGFSLGLALLGEELGRPGELIAAGMAGYGLATVAGSAVVPLVINRIPRMPAILVSWLVFGLAYLALPAAAPNLVLITAVSIVGGATMPFGIAALNALITERTTGAARRTAFTAQTVLHGGGASLGLLIGGALIGTFGSGKVLVVTGLIQMAAAVAATIWFRVRRPRAINHRSGGVTRAPQSS